MVHRNTDPDLLRRSWPKAFRIGGVAQFQVQVCAPANSAFQRRRNGTDIQGATGANHTITGVTADHAGNDDVGVSNASGSTLSSAAMPIVVPPDILLNGSGALSQTFRIIPEKGYRLDFDLGAFSLLNQNQQRVEVTLQGLSLLASAVRSVNSPGNGTPYQPQSMTFTADSTASILVEDNDPPARQGFYRLAQPAAAATE